MKARKLLSVLLTLAMMNIKKTLASFLVLVLLLGSLPLTAFATDVPFTIKITNTDQNLDVQQISATPVPFYSVNVPMGTEKVDIVVSMDDILGTMYSDEVMIVPDFGGDQFITGSNSYDKITDTYTIVLADFTTENVTRITFSDTGMNEVLGIVVKFVEDVLSVDKSDLKSAIASVPISGIYT